MRKGLIALLLGSIALSGSAAAPADQSASTPRVLLFSHTTGYRHSSIEPGIAALRQLGARGGLTVVPSEDPAVFDAQALRGFRAIIFLSSTTDPKRPESEWLTGARRGALQEFVRCGGGVVAIHAAADSHYGWTWYGRLIGGRFSRHPEGTPTGELTVTDRDHASTRRLPATIRRTDEWYYFDDYNPRARLLVTLDPQSIGEQDVNPNPISWAHEFEGGRVFYTAMGHTAESFSDRHVLAHIAGGLDWVLAKRDGRDRDR